jgi:hypothetical protein
MAEIIFMGGKMPKLKEFEAHSGDQEESRSYGFDVLIHKKNGKRAVYSNVTEVHYGYSGFTGCDRVAIESDIHKTGATIITHVIDKIEIRAAWFLSRAF